MEMLRPVGAHPRAQARRHHDRCEGPGHEGMIMAGAGGFEPPVTGPKPAALPLGYAPPSRAHRTPATGESPPAGSIEQEDCEEEEREQDEHEDRQELHDLPEQRDDQRDELRRGQDPGHLVHRRRAGSAAEQVQGDGHDRRSHAPEPPEAAEDDEQALDEGDQESDPEAALAQPARASALAMFDNWLDGHRLATLPDRSDEPDAGARPQPMGRPCRISPVVEEPIDRGAGSAYVRPKGAALEQLVDQAGASGGGCEDVRKEKREVPWTTHGGECLQEDFTPSFEFLGALHVIKPFVDVSS